MVTEIWVGQFSIVGGEASMTLDTTGMTPGTYRFFAAAIDNNSVWSAAV